MADEELLRIINDAADENGNAPGDVVRARFDGDFPTTFNALAEKAYIDKDSPTGTIRLTQAGRDAAPAS